MKLKSALVATFAALIFFTVFTQFQTNHTPEQHSVQNSSFQIEEMAHPEWVAGDYYNKNIQPIFDSKCIACHACYNSPCQLNLTNYMGVTRGANKKDPYDFPITVAGNPTRLGVDADSVKEWRKKGFYDIVGKDYNSLLLETINTERSEDYLTHDFHAENSRVCLKPSDLPVINLASRQQLTMPYGLPQLNEEEKKLIKEWIELGAPGPSQEVTDYFQGPRSKRVFNTIADWEKLLNGSDPKSKLSARYLYEHLFIAHIHFFDNSKEFFRLVRAKNLNGIAEELPTSRPFDAIKGKFYYRFKAIDQTLVSKDHTTFLLDEREKSRFQDQFVGGNWSVTEKELPDYKEMAANPFVTFKAIPRQTRYTFFLENARYFVMTFMKGPVCRGQTALNVINDHFWLFFLDPKFDLSANEDEAFNKYSYLMTPPAAKQDHIGIFNELRKNRWDAHAKKMAYYQSKNIQFNLESIWDGNGHDPNATLTIYRHFDSSDVLFGNQGKIPKTIWVMDYQIFEDIYYNLVAGYNLFGPISHQLNTRLYMELSRITSEDLFLTFLPKDQRHVIREEWSQESPKMKGTLIADLVKLIGENVSTKMERRFPFLNGDLETGITYKTKNTKEEFLSILKDQRLPKKDKIVYRWDSEYFTSLYQSQEWTDYRFNKMTKIKGPFVEDAPDSSLIKIKSHGKTDRVLTLILNHAHYNVNMLFVEDKRRNPSEDEFDMISGIATSYPNLYFEITENQIAQFIDQFEKAMKDKNLFNEFVNKYGVSRFRQDFWQAHHWFNNKYKMDRPIENGALDLNRYLSL